MKNLTGFFSLLLFNLRFEEKEDLTEEKTWVLISTQVWEIAKISRRKIRSASKSRNFVAANKNCLEVPVKRPLLSDKISLLSDKSLLNFCVFKWES